MAQAKPWALRCYQALTKAIIKFNVEVKVTPEALPGKT